MGQKHKLPRKGGGKEKLEDLGFGIKDLVWVLTPATYWCQIWDNSVALRSVIFPFCHEGHSIPMCRSVPGGIGNG